MGATNAISGGASSLAGLMYANSRCGNQVSPPGTYNPSSPGYVAPGSPNFNGPIDQTAGAIGSINGTPN